MNHTGETEIRNKIGSTCTELGYTGDTYCLACGEKISGGSDIPTLTHTDTDGDYLCDYGCGYEFEKPETPDEPGTPDDPADSCSHICHKGGFMGFIWKIIRIFCKLFGSQKTCPCGISHY